MLNYSKRSRVRDINALTGFGHTYYIANTNEGEILYIQYKGTGTHIIQGVLDVKSYSAKVVMEGQALPLNSPLIPVSIYIIRKGYVNRTFDVNKGTLTETTSTVSTITVRRVWGLQIVEDV